ncbi:S1 family peptidase [Kordiimonas marina]|uniref:S1 family peptidase n=1 Tax=Kordiimonas marina TaxID=2872312 RepID=UPI001FF4460E|nr:serine protease [Kordiimonas marina]
MRRRLEIIGYLAVLVYFVGRYGHFEIGVPQRPVPETPQRQIERTAPDETPLPRQDEATVVVDLDRHLRNSVGTAFAIGDGATYITARHVADGCRALYLLTGPQKRTKVSLAEIDHKRDFAILRAGLPHKGTLVLSDKAPKRGDDGFMMGFPQAKPADVRATVLGFTEMRSRGRYSAREPVIAWVERERRPFFEGALSGISGGPVLNADGDVIGTVVAGAPRRGRAYSTHPHVFDETNLMGRGGGHQVPLTPANFDTVGRAYREDGTVVQVYCKAS